MNWEAIGAIGEVIGAFAVVITLLYLSVQIRQNTKMMKATSKQQISDATQQITGKMLDEPEVATKLLFSGEELVGLEHTKAWLLLRAVIRGYENQIFQYQVGMLDEAEWLDLERVIEQSARMPGFAALWPELSDSASASLREIIDKALDDLHEIK